MTSRRCDACKSIPTELQIAPTGTLSYQEQICITSNMITIGVCSLCGGKVCMHEMGMVSIPDIPTCSNCGAVKKESLPVIEMQRTTVPLRELMETKQLTIDY